jgi:hypothetical protein
MSPVISKRSARWLLGLVEQLGGGEAERVAADLKHALRLRPGLKVAKKERETKRTARNRGTAAIHEAVMARAQGACEACQAQAGRRLEMDHFFGRVRAEQSDATCWAICPPCHRQKTENSPSAAHWLEEFIRHAERHGFDDEAALAARRLESGALMIEAIASAEMAGAK